MQISAEFGKYNPKFTSVIPVRVFIDGMETYSEKNIRTAGRQLTTLLAGPTKNNETASKIATQLAMRDPDYDFSKAYVGLKLKDNFQKSSPSKFFRLVKDRDNNKFYLFTGAQGEHLSALGKSVGNERYTSKLNNCEKSFDLHVAKQNYVSYIKNCIKNSRLRITELYNCATRQKIGSPVTLNINMVSNKKYGKSTFKMNLNDCNLTYRIRLNKH